MGKVWNSNRLKKVVNNSGYKRDFLSNKIGYSRGALANVLSGNKKPSIELLVIVANFLKTSAEYLDHKTDDPRPHNERLG